MVRFVPHVIGAILAMAYAWSVSRTPYLQTGLQFVAPVMVILFTHVAWAWATGARSPGYSARMLSQSSQTVLAMLGVVAVSQVIAPMPSQAASATEIGCLVLTVLFCVLVLVAVGFIVLFAVRLLLRGVKAAAKIVRNRDDDHLNDGAVLLTVFLALAGMSLEGLSWAYRFDGAGQGTASRWVAADVEAVWEVMGTATSPDVPLPGVLQAFPQPVDVVTDEGVDLGVNRVVRLSGREGSGLLSLQVTERSAGHVTFEVQSNTSPMANWIAFRSLTYRVSPERGGTQVETTLTYDGLLAPQWVFRPIKKAAAYFAMDVLARDILGA